MSKPKKVPSKAATRTTPLRVMFFTTSMPVGGAETLLVNLLRRLDRSRFAPELCCIKDLGPLGKELATELPVHHDFIRSKADVRVLWRLKRLLHERQIDAVVTVGAGDKMFWGRLAAKLAGVPVVCSALHSTGWPDGVGRLNRLLTPITDAFIGVATPHGRHLVENERFPEAKVFVIPNGIDTDRFAPAPSQDDLRRELRIRYAVPIVGMVAALRPEKNHELFLQVARRVVDEISDAVFVVVGDGPQRESLEALAQELRISPSVRFVGTRSDIPRLLNLFDLNMLTSHNEANPVSILEAMGTATPTVATDVGSVSESVIEGQTGHLATAGDADTLAEHAIRLLVNPLEGQALGENARRLVVQRWSLESMVAGYENLLAHLYESKTERALAVPVGEPILVSGTL